MDRSQLHPLLYLVLVIGLAASSFGDNQTTKSSQQNVTGGNDSFTPGSNHSSTSPLVQTTVVTTLSTNTGWVSKEETSGSMDSTGSTSSTITPACLRQKEMQVQVLVLALGVAVMLCVMLLVTTIVLAFQLCQLKQRRPSPRPLRCNADLIRSQEAPADGNLADAGMLLIQVELDKVEKDGDMKEEPEQSTPPTSGVQEPESAPPPADPAPDPTPRVDPAAAVSADTAEGALTA